MGLVFVFAAAVVVIRLAFREKPRYTKLYFEIKEAFGTKRDSDFARYLEHVRTELRASLTQCELDLSSNVEDMCYAPDVAGDWQTVLDRWHRTKEIAEAVLSIAAVLLMADAITRLLASDQVEAAEKLVGMAIAGGTYAWLLRRLHATSKTKGYLDGYVDAWRWRDADEWRRHKEKMRRRDEETWRRIAEPAPEPLPAESIKDNAVFEKDDATYRVLKAARGKVIYLVTDAEGNNTADYTTLDKFLQMLAGATHESSTEAGGQ
jgi:hypothetical protein